MSEGESKSWLQLRWWLATIIASIIASQIQEFMTSWQFFLIAIVILIMVASLLLANILLENGEFPRLSISETEDLPEFVKILGATLALVSLFLAANLIVLISGPTTLELLGIGSTHNDRLGLILDIMGITYSIVGLVLVAYLGHLLLKYAFS